MVVALMVKVGVDGVNCKAKVFDAPPTLAVSVTVCAELKDPTVAAKEALVAFAGTVTEDGAVTVLLVLEMATFTPPVGAAPESVGVQVTLPAPVIDELLHEKALRVGAVAVPVPPRLTTAVGLDEELLEMVNWPVAEPAAVGRKLTASAMD
jgi:hypothetical protein